MESATLLSAGPLGSTRPAPATQESLARISGVRASASIRHIRGPRGSAGRRRRERETVAGEFVALLITVSVPVAGPVLAGVNFIVKRAVAFGARTSGYGG